MESADVLRIFNDGKEDLKNAVAFAWVWSRQGIVWLNLAGFEAQVADWTTRGRVKSDEADNFTVHVDKQAFYVAIIRPSNPSIILPIDPLFEALHDVQKNGMAYFFKNKERRDEVVKLISRL